MSRFSGTPQPARPAYPQRGDTPIRERQIPNELVFFTHSEAVAFCRQRNCHLQIKCKQYVDDLNNRINKLFVVVLP